MTPATLTAKRLNLRKSWHCILGSCNGLLLVHRLDDLRLVNPTTGKILKIPYFSDRYNDAYGVGYDSVTDDYKVITISRMTVPHSDPRSHFVNVYSLRNNSLSMFPICPYKQYDYHTPRGVLLNNILHWVVVRNGSETMTMVTFSLANEEFHEMELLESMKCSQDPFERSQVFALGGKLVAVFKDHHKFFYEMWVMEEYGVPKSWTKLFMFENNMDLAFELFAQVSNRDILLGINKANELFIYNMDERRCTSVAIEGCPEEYFFYNTSVESLESFEHFG
ncbi:F-box/kelch-repeat protein At3g06240-like [Rutidosis leptorrhynchoides]|uniref:F-box/kelch-repeat protein At3g06240-like n=1 Tax=Rutidosis leptorrhynchoides TaxID=125765 RepID=UPI003A998C67